MSYTPEIKSHLPRIILFRGVQPKKLWHNDREPSFTCSLIQLDPLLGIPIGTACLWPAVFSVFQYKCPTASAKARRTEFPHVPLSEMSCGCMHVLGTLSSKSSGVAKALPVPLGVPLLRTAEPPWNVHAMTQSKGENGAGKGRAKATRAVLPQGSQHGNKFTVSSIVSRKVCL